MKRSIAEIHTELKDVLQTCVLAEDASDWGRLVTFALHLHQLASEMVINEVINGKDVRSDARAA